jgi:hypothetical protein
MWHGLLDDNMLVVVGVAFVKQGNKNSLEFACTSEFSMNGQKDWGQ